MKHIPQISSGTKGPLGVFHLPRLWQKLTLGAKGVLAEGYDECGQGYDQMVLDGIGIDRDAIMAFVKDSNPTYPQLEAWILQQKGGAIDTTAIESLNAAIAGYNHSDDVRKTILADSGIEDDGTILDAINLNNLDDWYEFHKSLG